jgi:hypothetical protein
MPKRLTLQDAQEYATNKGGKCLSSEYINDETLMAWRCKRGHTWDMQFQVIRRGAWCNQCRVFEIKEEQLEEYKTLAIERGGRCLATEYKNNHTKILFECKEGHQWKAAPRIIKEGSWCPTCAGWFYTIQDMIDLAAEHNGKCLSEKYKNYTTKLVWQCSEGHVWMAGPGNIIHGSWCPKCAYKKNGERQRGDIEKYRNIVREKGGKLLSDTHINSHTHLYCECSKGHIWRITPGNIISGHWCPYCSGKAKHSMADMRAYAKAKGGKCLSKNYVNTYAKLQWQCSMGHTWEAAPNNIIHNDSWCPVCYNNVCVKNLGVYYKKKS